MNNITEYWDVTSFPFDLSPLEDLEIDPRVQPDFFMQPFDQMENLEETQKEKSVIKSSSNFENNVFQKKIEQKHITNNAKQACFKALTSGCIATPSPTKGTHYCKVYLAYQSAVLNKIKKKEILKIKFEIPLKKYLNDKTLLGNQLRYQINQNPSTKKYLKEFLGIKSKDSTFPFGEKSEWKITNLDAKTGHSTLYEELKEKIKAIFEKIPIESFESTEFSLKIRTLRPKSLL
jgi:hypothetical protein